MSSIDLVLPACEPRTWRRAELLAALKIELQPMGSSVRPVTPSERPTAGVWLLTIDRACAVSDENPRLRVRAADGSTSDRTLPLADTPADLRARTLALTLAELIRTALAKQAPAVRRARVAPTGPDAKDSQRDPARAKEAPGEESQRGSNSDPPRATSRGVEAASSAPAEDVRQRASITRPTRAAIASGATASPLPSSTPDPTRAADAGSTTASPLPSSTPDPLRTTNADAPSTTAHGQRTEVSSNDAARVPSAVESSALTAFPAAAGTRPAASDVGGGRATAELARARGEADLTLALRPTFRVFTAHGDAMWGGELALRWRRWVLGLSGLFGAYTDALGSARVGRATALSAYELLQLRSGDFEFDAGPRVALGVIWASASANSNSTGIATEGYAALFVWEAGAEIAANYDLDADWMIGLHCTSGYATGARFKANDRVLAEPAGLFIGAGLTVAASWR